MAKNKKYVDLTPGPSPKERGAEPAEINRIVKIDVFTASQTAAPVYRYHFASVASIYRLLNFARVL